MTKILICGEAYGEKEEEQRRPFVGPSGHLLTQMLSQAGIDRSDCYLTNVFNLRPRPKNDVVNLCGPKAAGIPGLPQLAKGKYVDAKYAPELDRLFSEVRAHEPNLIIALGATAAWAFLHSSGIKANRGAVAETHPAVSKFLGRTYKVLPTFHPAMVLRDFSSRPVVISDLTKAARESAFPEVRRPERTFYLEPVINDLLWFEREFMAPGRINSVDIETKGNQITCIGFAPDRGVAIVIPIFSPSTNQSYWSPEDEVRVWQIISQWLRDYPSLFQNGIFDMHVLWRYYGIPTPCAAEDTLLMHHAMQPELQKGLGFLATIYTDEVSWKGMRKESMKHD